MEFEVVDELPAGGRGNVSDYEQIIDTYITACDEGLIKNKTDDGRSVWAVIKTGDNKESISAATSQLKDKYGDVTCKGLSFASRPYIGDNSLRAIYVCYEPEKIVEGYWAEHDKKRRARIKALNEKAAAKKAATKVEAPLGSETTVASSTQGTKKG